MEQQKLTLAEALEQGFTHFFYKDEGYQAMNELSDITDADFARGVELVNKETENIESYVSAEDIRDFIAQASEERHAEQTGCDTEAVYPLIKDMPLHTFFKIIDEVNEAMKSLCYYKSSGIVLVKN